MRRVANAAPALRLDMDMRCLQKLGGESNSPVTISLNKGVMYVRVEPLSVHKRAVRVAVRVAVRERFEVAPTRARFDK
eukprot:8533229-Pyramimonas_sp.AAC.1